MLLATISNHGNACKYFDSQVKHCVSELGLATECTETAR